MPISQAVLVYGVGALFLILAIAAFSRKKSEKVLGMGKTLAGVLAILLGAFLIAGQHGDLSQFGVTFAVANGGANTGGENVNPTDTIATYQPTAAYSGKDVFSSSAVTGTAYYKPNSQPATTTAYTNVNVGDDVTYWLSNDSYYVAPKQKIVGAGVNSFVADAYQNASVTITGYDLTNRQVTTSGSYNTSMGANDVANIEVTYQGTAKKSAAPFGGVMVVEYNSTIASVTCTGDDLLSSNPFQVTYTANKLTSAYKVFAFGSTLDDGTGTPKRISCQFQNGNAVTGDPAAYYFKFIPANYYISNDGRILLDVEKAANNDNTRTQIANTIGMTSYWGA